ncbi:MAG: hypothetical protein GC162_08310 [Planctomycetes bacterium]|nr:hypothetical protein [Planctomycetota bacterium]
MESSFMGLREQKALRRYMRGLARQERYALMMYHVDQLTPHEISLVLDLPFGQIVAMIERLGREARLVLERAAQSLPLADTA